jgi:hypothetical protein
MNDTVYHSERFSHWRFRAVGRGQAQETGEQVVDTTPKTVADVIESNCSVGWEVNVIVEQDQDARLIK